MIHLTKFPQNTVYSPKSEAIAALSWAARSSDGSILSTSDSIQNTHIQFMFSQN